MRLRHGGAFQIRVVCSACKYLLRAQRAQHFWRRKAVEHCTHALTPPALTHIR